MAYRSPEDSLSMKQYRADMADCIRLPRCYPVAPSNYQPGNGGAMMGNSHPVFIGRGGGGGHGSGHGGGHGGHGGHGGFTGRGGRGFVAYGGPWGGFYDGPYWYDGYVMNPCDYDPYSYECFLASGGGRPVNAARSMMVLGNGTDYYSRVQASNLLPRFFKFPR